MPSGSTQPTQPDDEDSAQRDAEDRWQQALESYQKETGHNLLEMSFAKELLSQRSADEVMAHLKDFMAYRARGHKLLGVLKPIVSVVLLFVDAGAEGASVRVLTCHVTEYGYLTT